MYTTGGSVSAGLGIGVGEGRLLFPGRQAASLSGRKGDALATPRALSCEAVAEEERERERAGLGRRHSRQAQGGRRAGCLVLDLRLGRIERGREGGMYAKAVAFTAKG